MRLAAGTVPHLSNITEKMIAWFKCLRGRTIFSDMENFDH